jgi:HPt (histidine-containing phosphotransfer) domain-containing protein
MDGYVAKPISATALFDEIRRVGTAASSPDRFAGPAAHAGMSSITSSGETFDRKQALARLEGDSELLDELLALAAETLAEHRVKIEHAVAANDVSALRASAHTLKGAVGNICAHRAAKAAIEVELLADGAQKDDVQRRAAALLEEIAALARDIRAAAASQ